MKNHWQLILEIETPRANLAEMIQAVQKATGDSMPFFCPPVTEWQPYKGHTHVFPPPSATGVSVERIIVGE